MPYQSSETHPMLVRMINNLIKRNPELRMGALSSSIRNDSLNSTVFRNRGQLVGRQPQLQLLNECFARMEKVHTSELVMVHGPSGTGKSALIKAYVASLPPEIFHVQGKFDQFQSHTPYAALVAASDHLCRQILLRENSEVIRDRIRAILGQDATLLGKIVPTLTQLFVDDGSISHEHQVNEGSRAFTRFKLLFRAFLRCVASAETPVVFFLDDLQWADPASLEVVEALVTDSMSHHVMIICTYREGEMSGSLLQQYHLAAAKTNDDDAGSMDESGGVGQITDISVAGLDMASLNELVASMLGMDESDTQSLSTLVWSKTGGIPFYVLSFLDMLRTTELLSLQKDGSWIWDEYQILLQTNVADNLAAILATKLQNLPDEVRSILQIASFIGYDFPTNALVTIVYEEQDMIQVKYSFERQSKEAIGARIIAALNLAVKEGLLETTSECDDFKFSHDQIQKVLYEDLIPDDTERQLLHQRIGTLIWNSFKETEPSQRSDWPIFMAADNLNSALGVVDYSGSRYELIELNLIAAKRATAKFAFIVAAQYLRVAVSLLEGDKSWDEHYDMCLDLYSTAAKAEQNISCYSRTKMLVTEIHKRATTLQREYVAYEIDVNSLLLQGDSKGSVSLGLDVLRKLGVKFPCRITATTMFKELLRSKVALGRRHLLKLLELPEITDERLILAMKMMSTVAINCLILSDSFMATFAAVSLRMFYLTLRYGLSPRYSPMAIVLYGAFHVALGRIDIAMEAEQLAFAIIDTYREESIRGSTTSISVGMIRFWRNKFDRSTCDELLHGYYTAMSFGHIIHAQYGYSNWLSVGTYVDESLVTIITRTRCFVEEMRQYDVVSCLIFLLPRWQILLNLSGDPTNTDPSCLRGEAMNDEFSQRIVDLGSKRAFCILKCNELMLAYTFENWDVVRQALPILRTHEKDIAGHFSMGFVFTWSALCHYDLYRAEGHRKHKREGRRAHNQVRKWATTGTEILDGAHHLLNAMESLCVSETPLDQVEVLFATAMTACAEGRCVYFEAIANERLARFFLDEVEDEAKAQKYLSRAMSLYRNWGAVAKADWLATRSVRTTKVVG